VAGPILSLRALVLTRPPPAESFQTHQIFSDTEGLLRVLRRIPRRPAADHFALDLFDEVQWLLESPRDGGGWFVKEARLLHREGGLGRSYETLAAASRLATLITRNPVPTESRAAVYRLLQSAFAALAAGGRPEVVLFKGTYCLARDEGYPLKQQWFPALPAADRRLVTGLLNLPVEAQSLPAAEVGRLQRRLEDYLRAETDILPA
jgi:hypothetical protein